MAYVRRHYGRIVLVHGVRDGKTGKVIQRILFALYSKEEARAALGKSREGVAEDFQEILTKNYPGIRFDWKAIRRGIEKNLRHLPKTYDSKEARLFSTFRDDLLEFARGILYLNPRETDEGEELLRNYRPILSALADAIRMRLRDLDILDARGGKNPWRRKDEFAWRFSLRSKDVPSDAEEYASDLFEEGKYDEAETWFRLLVECFPGYADGYNFLGIIALEKGKIGEAVPYFEKTVAEGRKLFSKRFSKKRLWLDLDTRPYIRGIRNLALAYVEHGRYDDALLLCDQLEWEIGDTEAAYAHRASVFLNLGRWEKVVEAATKAPDQNPEESFKAAFALFELGKKKEALGYFLHGLFNWRRGARLLLGLPTDGPETRKEFIEHGSGVHLPRSLGRYLRERERPSLTLFRRTLGVPKVQKTLGEIADLEAKLESGNARYPGRRAWLERLRELQGVEFARKAAEGVVSWLAG